MKRVLYHCWGKCLNFEIYRVMLKHIFSTFLLTTIVITHNYSLAAKPKTSGMRESPPVHTSIVVDTTTGKVLHSHNAKKKTYPASLAKLMTLDLLFDSIESGKLSMNQKLYVSKNAEQMQPCKLGLKEGEYITVRDAVMALIVKSANDAAVVVAENIAGSEKRFANMMNRKAKQLGMQDTHFTNASGWHNPDQRTTAVDLAKLAIAIKRDHPRFYPLFAQTSFNFRGKIVNGHNHVTANYAWSEGLKTGYTKPAGYNLITTASRKDKQIVGVITGGKSATSRDRLMVALLDKHLGIAKNSDKKSQIISGKKQSKKLVRG